MPHKLTGGTEMELKTTGLLEGLFDFLFLFKDRTMNAICIRSNPSIVGLSQDIRTFLETQLSREDVRDLHDMLRRRLKPSDSDVQRFEYSFRLGKRRGVMCGATVRIEPLGLYMGFNIIAENSPRRDAEYDSQPEKLRLLASGTGIISFEYRLSSDTMTYSLNKPGEEYSEHQLRDFLKGEAETDSLLSPLKSMTASAAAGVLPEEAVCLLGDDGCGSMLYHVRMIPVRDESGEVSSVFGKAERHRAMQSCAAPYTRPAELSTMEKRWVGVLASLSFDLDSGKLLRQSESLIPGVLGDLDTIAACIARISTLIHPDYLERFINITVELMRLEEAADDWTRELVCRLHLNDEDVDSYHTCLLTIIVHNGSGAARRILQLGCVDVSDVKEYSSTGVIARKDMLTGLFLKDSFRAGLLSGDIGGIREPDIDAAAIVQLDDYDLIQSYTTISEFDELIFKMSDLLMSALDTKALAFRFGDATFGLIFVHTPNAAFIRTRLKSILESMTVELSNGFTAGVSIGCYMSFWSEKNTYDEMIDMARRALLRSRRNGGGRISYYSEDDSRETTGREKRVFIRTFGRFDIFINGRPVSFSSGKAKEFLALLVDRRGGSITNQEALTILWPDDAPDNSTKQKCRKATYNLSRTLRENGIENILIIDGRERAINIDEVRCDYYEYLAGINEQEFKGAYLDEYSWAETTLAELMYNKRKKS